MFIFFPKLMWVLFIFPPSYIEYWEYVLIILDYFCRNNFQIGNIIYNLTFYLLFLKDIWNNFALEHFTYMMSFVKTGQLMNNLCASWPPHSVLSPIYQKPFAHSICWEYVIEVFVNVIMTLCCFPFQKNLQLRSITKLGWK
jgi:hypothetical protein